MYIFKYTNAESRLQTPTGDVYKSQDGGKTFKKKTSVWPGGSTLTTIVGICVILSLSLCLSLFFPPSPSLSFFLSLSLYVCVYDEGMILIQDATPMNRLTPHGESLAWAWL